MKFRVFSVVLAVVMLCTVLCLSGCGKDKVIEVSSQPEETSEASSKPDTSVNPLTGLDGMDPSAFKQRPVAVMVNNIKTAQSVQTGLNDADIVYEAYAEGGITRLLAVYKDISKVGNIGTVRSARYSYVDLAMGHDALYVHAGMDPTKCKAHIAETGIDNFNMLNGGPSKYSFRVKNGKALEHTLYTSGAKLNEGFAALNYRRDLKADPKNWQSFVPEDSPVTPADGSCKEAVVTMSADYISRFKYDSATGRYLKFSGSSAHKDYRTGKQLSFKNILVLKTDVTAMESTGYLQKTGLTGGEGYYISNGGYQNIKWSKGAASNPITITLTDGSDCSYNAGNTWVCLVDRNHSVTITGDTATSSAVQ